MSQTVDQRIVEMQIDSEEFERGAKKVMGVMDKLKAATDFGDFGTGDISDSFDTLADKFEKTTNGLYSRWKQNFHDKLVHDLNMIPEKFLAPFKQIASQLTDLTFTGIDQIGSGFQKYGDKTTAVSTLLAQGYELEKVNELMEQLNWFTDETSYNFVDMVGNISKWTAAGQDLDESVMAMEGIALWTALSGQGATKASQAMYQLSQAMQKGVLKYDDYKSIQNASMDTKEFREQAVAAAEALGQLKRVGEDTWKTIGSSAKDEADLEKARKQLDAAYDALDDANERRAMAQSRVSDAYARQSEATSNAAARSAARSIESAEYSARQADRAVTKAIDQVDEMKQKVLEAEADMNKGFSLSELFSSDALSRNMWFTSDVMMEVFTNYAKAAKEIKRYQDENNLSTATAAIEELEAKANELAVATGVTLDEAFQRLGYDVDEFSLKAFKAGQEARTWRDVVDSLRDAVSTGWMNTFELIFGTAKDATKFWTQLANSFYNLFASGGDIRNDILEIGFGYGKTQEEIEEATAKTAKTVERSDDGWMKFTKRIEESGHTMAEFEDSCRKVIDATDGIQVDQLVAEYGSLKNAFQEGAISGELFKEILNDLSGEAASGSDEIVEATEKVSYSFDDLKEVAYGIIRGDYGNGEERKKLLEELGYNYDLVQGMAEIIYNGGQGYVGLTEELLRSEYPTFYAMLQEQVSAVNESVSEANDAFADSDELLQDIQTNIIDVTQGTQHTIEQIKGSDLFKGGITNILTALENVQEASRQAFSSVFGNAEDIGKKLYQMLGRFHEFTENLKSGSENLGGFQHTMVNVYTIVKNIGELFVPVGRLIWNLGNAFLSFGKGIISGLFGNKEIVKGSEQISKSLQGIIKSVAEFTKLSAPALELVGKKLGQKLTELLKYLPKAWEALKITGRSLLDAIPTLEQGLAKAISAILDKIGELVPGWDETLQKWRGKIAETFGIVTAEGEKVLPEWDELGLNLTKIVYRMFEAIGRVFGKEGLGKTFLEFKFYVEDVYKAVKDFLATDVTTHINDAFDSIRKFFTDKSIFSFKISDLFGGQKAVDEASGAMEQIQHFFGEMGKSAGTKIVTGDIAFKANTIFPSQQEIDGEADTFFGHVFHAIQESFQKINWGQAFNLGKLVAMGYGLFNLNKLLTSIRTTVDPKKNGLLGVVSALKTTIANIGAPFFQFSKKIEREGRADEMIKLASAIGILSLALIGLSTIDEQTLFNVAAVMSGLMLLLKMLSGAGQGIQIFSNNAKKITGETKNSIHVLEKLDFEKLKDKLVSITLTGNVIPPAMGALMGIAAVIAAIGYVFIKIRDIKDIHDVLPALQIIGGIMLSVGVLAGLVGALGPRMKGLGGTLVGLGIFFALIGHTFKTLSDINFSISGIFAVIMAVIAAAALLHTLGDQLNKTLAENMGVGSLMSFAALIVSVGLLFKMIASSLTVLSVLNKDGLMTASVSILLVSLGIAAIVYAISKVPPEASMLKAAASLMVAALAIQMMMIPIGIIAAAIKWLNMETALLHAAEGVVVFIAAMALIVGLLSKFGGDNLTKAAGSLALLSLTFVGISASLLLLKDMDPESLIPIAIALGVLFAELSVAMGILTSLDHIENALVVAAGLTGASLAFVALGGALRMIGEVDSEGVKSAAIALGILFAVLVGAVAGLTFLKNPEKMLSVATALLVAAAAIDVLALGLAGLSYAFVQVIQNGSWESLGEKTKAFAAALDPIAPYLIGIVVALGAFVAVGALVGDKIGMMGLGFAGVGAGVLALVYSFTMLPEAVQGVVDAMTVLNENIGKIIEFVGIVFTVILAVWAIKEKDLIKRAVHTFETLATAITSTKTLATVGTAVQKLVSWLLVFLAGNMPGFVEKLVVLIIGLFNALSESINAHASEIAVAVEKTLVSLINVIMQVLMRLVYDAVGAILGGIGWIIEKVTGKDLSADTWAGQMLSFENWHNVANELTGDVQAIGDIVFDTVDKDVSDHAQNAAQIAINEADQTLQAEGEKLQETTENIVNDAGDAALSSLQENSETLKTEAEESSKGILETVKDQAEDWIGAHAEDLNITNWFSADGTINPEDQANLDAYAESFLSAASEGGDEAGMSFMSQFVDSADPNNSENESLLSTLWGDFKENVIGASDDFAEAGNDLGDDLTDGMKENIPEASEEYVELTEKQLNEHARKHEQDFKDIGIYAMWQVKDGYFIAVPEKAAEMALNTVNGLSDAVFNEKDKLHALGELLFQWTKEGYEDAADINSPSKVMEQEMSYTIDGIVKGAKRHGHRAFQAFEKVGDDMMLAMRNSMSMLALAVDQDYDLQPTITPVVDLGAAVDGARALKNMMRGGELRQVLDSYSSMDGLAVSGAVLNYTNQNAPVTSAIRDLSNRMDRIGNTLDNDRNFNVGIRVEHMAVRDEGDIKLISRQLAKEVRVALRQKGR